MVESPESSTRKYGSKLTHRYLLTVPSIVCLDVRGGQLSRLDPVNVPGTRGNSSEGEGRSTSYPHLYKFPIPLHLCSPSSSYSHSYSSSSSYSCSMKTHGAWEITRGTIGDRRAITPSLGAMQREREMETERKRGQQLLGGWIALFPYVP